MNDTRLIRYKEFIHIKRTYLVDMNSLFSPKCFTTLSWRLDALSVKKIENFFYFNWEWWVEIHWSIKRWTDTIVVMLIASCHVSPGMISFGPFMPRVVPARARLIIMSCCAKPLMCSCCPHARAYTIFVSFSCLPIFMLNRIRFFVVSYFYA